MNRPDEALAFVAECGIVLVNRRLWPALVRLAGEICDAGLARLADRGWP